MIIYFSLDDDKLFLRTSESCLDITSLVLKWSHLNGDLYWKYNLNLNMTNYLGRSNAMCQFHFWSPTQLRFRMMQLYKLGNKEHLWKDIPLSFVTHWNYSGCWAASMPWSHLFYLLPSQTMSSRVGTGEGGEGDKHHPTWFLFSLFSVLSHVLM